MTPVTRTEELRARLLGFRPTDRLIGWLGPCCSRCSGLMRFWRSTGRTSWCSTGPTTSSRASRCSGIRRPMRWAGEGKVVDPLFTHGNLNVFITDNGDMVVHPPVGKWVIAFGGGSSARRRVGVALLGRDAPGRCRS